MAKPHKSDCAFWLQVFGLTLMLHGFRDQDPPLSAVPATLQPRPEPDRAKWALARTLRRKTTVTVDELFRNQFLSFGYTSPKTKSGRALRGGGKAREEEGTGHATFRRHGREAGPCSEAKAGRSGRKVLGGEHLSTAARPTCWRVSHAGRSVAADPAGPAGKACAGTTPGGSVRPKAAPAPRPDPSPRRIARGRRWRR